MDGDGVHFVKNKSIKTIIKNVNIEFSLCFEVWSAKWPPQKQTAGWFSLRPLKVGLTDCMWELEWMGVMWSIENGPLLTPTK